MVNPLVRQRLAMPPGWLGEPRDYILIFVIPLIRNLTSSLVVCRVNRMQRNDVPTGQRQLVLLTLHYVGEPAKSAS